MCVCVSWGGRKMSRLKSRAEAHGACARRVVCCCLGRCFVEIFSPIYSSSHFFRNSFRTNLLFFCNRKKTKEWMIVCVISLLHSSESPVLFILFLISSFYTNGLLPLFSRRIARVHTVDDDTPHTRSARSHTHTHGIVFSLYLALSLYLSCI